MGKEKNRLWPVKYCCLPSFYSKDLVAQPPTFLTTLLWGRAHGTAFSKAQKLPAVKVPSWWGFWAQALPLVLFAALYNKPSPTQIHIFIILFLEMQFVEGKLGTWFDILIALDSSIGVSVGSGCKHSSLPNRSQNARHRPCVSWWQAVCLAVAELPSHTAVSKPHPVMLLDLIAILSDMDCEWRDWVLDSVVQWIRFPGNFQVLNWLLFLQATVVYSACFINAFYTGTREKAPLVMCLLCKWEDLGSRPRSHVR